MNNDYTIKESLELKIKIAHDSITLLRYTQAFNYVKFKR